ncbi:hypothetical protein J6590_083453 [Homalodisca vitripennis]|nr:hypothetical protein J6590_083453 [Homalodisca vitripennis]
MSTVIRSRAGWLERGEQCWSVDHSVQTLCNVQNYQLSTKQENFTSADSENANITGSTTWVDCTFLLRPISENLTDSTTWVLHGSLADYEFNVKQQPTKEGVFTDKRKFY